MHALPYWRLSGYYFFYFAFNGAFLPFFGLYLLSLGFSAWDIGLLMSMQQAMRLIGPSLWGWLADSRQRRVPIIQLAALVSLFCFAGFFWLRSFPPMLLAMAILAFFWSAALPLVETLTFNHLREASGQYSRIRVWGSIGFILAVLGTGALLDQVRIDTLLWVCLLLLAGILATATILPDAAPSSATANEAGLHAVLRQRRVQALFAACFAMSAAHGALYVFYSIHLTDHAYNKTAVGLLWTLGVVAEIALFMVMPRLLRRYSLRAILLASYAVAVVRFLLIGWCITILPLALLAQLMHGLTFGTYHAASIAAVNQWFPGRAQARGQALYSSLSFGAGGLLGALVSGWIWEHFGAAWTYSLSSVFALIGFVFILFGVPAQVEAQSGKD